MNSLKTMLPAILLNALNIVKTRKSDQFWGSEENILLSNSACELTSAHVGFDIAEDDEWSHYCIKATDEEISTYNIDEMIKRSKLPIKDKQPLFLVCLSNPDLFNQWETLYNNTQILDLWTSEDISLIKGLCKQEMDQIHALNKGDGLMNFSAHKHNIFRIK